MSIATELTLLANSKQAIKNSINQKGGNITDSTPLADYSTAIDNLPSGGSGNPLLKTIDVSDFTGTKFIPVAKYITDVTIPSGVTMIDGSALSGCSSVTSVTMPNTLTYIGNNVFQNCSSLTSITIPSGVTSIGSGAFSGCTGLTSISIPNTLTSLGNYAFQNCTSLASITIPSGIGSIGSQLFMNCTSLRSVTIPSNILSIQMSAFNNCTGLTHIIVEATTPPTLGNTPFTNTNDCPIYVPAESVDAYKAASGWSSYASRIQAIPAE